MQQVVCFQFDRFALDDAVRPKTSIGEKNLLARSFRIVWSLFSSGPDACLGSTQSNSFAPVGDQLVCRFGAAPGEVVVDDAILANFSARVILFRLIDDTASGSSTGSGSSRRRNSIPASSVFASGTIDPAAFLRKPPRDYCVKMETNFTTIGKLYFHLAFESLESKRLADRTTIQKRLLLRIERVVTKRAPPLPGSSAATAVAASTTPTSAVLPKSPGMPTSPAGAAAPSVSFSQNQRARPQPAKVPSASSFSFGSEESSTGASSHPSSASLIAKGCEYLVKVRLSTSAEVHRTPLAICDEEGRVRWGYEIPLNLPSSAPDETDVPMSEPQDDDVSSVHRQPPSTSSSLLAPIQPGGTAKVLFALLEGSQVVSTFAIDAKKFRTNTKTWTEYAIPAPCANSRHHGLGAGSDAKGPNGAVVFEISAKHVDVLKLTGGASGGPPSRQSSQRTLLSNESTTPVGASAPLVLNDGRGKPAMLLLTNVGDEGGGRATARATVNRTGSASLGNFVPEHPFGDSLSSAASSPPRSPLSVTRATAGPKAAAAAPDSRSIDAPGMRRSLPVAVAPPSDSREYTGCSSPPFGGPLTQPPTPQQQHDGGGGGGAALRLALKGSTPADGRGAATQMSSKEAPGQATVPSRENGRDLLRSSVFSSPRNGVRGFDQQLETSSDLSATAAPPSRVGAAVHRGTDDVNLDTSAMSAEAGALKKQMDEQSKRIEDLQRQLTLLRRSTSTAVGDPFASAQRASLSSVVTGWGSATPIRASSSRGEDTAGDQHRGRSASASSRRATSPLTHSLADREAQIAVQMPPSNTRSSSASSALRPIAGSSSLDQSAHIGSEATLAIHSRQLPAVNSAPVHSEVGSLDVSRASQRYPSGRDSPSPLNPRGFTSSSSVQRNATMSERAPVSATASPAAVSRVVGGPAGPHVSVPKR